MENGFITIHRKITEWEWYKDGNTCRLFIHLLLRANHKDSRWRGIDIKRGQTIVGRKVLAEELLLGEQQIRTALDHLKSTNEITIKSTNKYSLVTLVNYDLYQSEKQHVTNKTSTKRPSSNHQVTTNNNDNNDNKNTYRTFAHLYITDEENQKLVDKYGSQSIVDDVYDDIENYSKNKNYKSLYLTANKWLKKRQGEKVKKQDTVVNGLYIDESCTPDFSKE